ncbi:MAG: glycine cleavage system protein H [Deltaproteobacteria bacterium]|nr:MAG: glycine cleavage system protein H [Deltaproteobacteria bacterium]
MARIDKYDMPDDLYYTTDHAWVKAEGNQIRIGVTDFMQQMAGEITFIRLPRAGKELEVGKTLCTLQSGKWAGKVLVPMQALVVDVNKDLAANPQILNAAPYNRGWIAVLEPADLAAGLGKLLKGDEAIAWLKTEIAKHAA